MENISERLAEQVLLQSVEKFDFDNNIMRNGLADFFIYNGEIYYFDTKYVWCYSYITYLREYIDFANLKCANKEVINNIHVVKNDKRFFYATDTLYDEYLDDILIGGDMMLIDNIFINAELVGTVSESNMYADTARRNQYQTVYEFNYEKCYDISDNIKEIIILEKCML